MNKYREKLAALVREGPVADIFRAEQALSILDTTGLVAREINENNYGEVFSTFQTFCINQFVLSVSKLYDNPKRYPLKSVPAVLRYLKKNVEHLEITEPNLLKQQLVRLSLYTPEFDKLDPAGKNLFIHEKLYDLLPDVSSNKALDALKTLRDKKIAHPEDINVESLPKTRWDLAEELLQYPKDVVGVIGDGYLNTAYMLEDGEYLLTSDATRVGRGIKRLLKNLGVMASNKAVEKDAQ